MLDQIFSPLRDDCTAEPIRGGAGGKRFGDKGYYVEPTVFADVGDDMAIGKEEIFGPVQVIMKFDRLDDVRPARVYLSAAFSLQPPPAPSCS